VRAPRGCGGAVDRPAARHGARRARPGCPPGGAPSERPDPRLRRRRAVPRLRCPQAPGRRARGRQEPGHALRLLADRGGIPGVQGGARGGGGAAAMSGETTTRRRFPTALLLTCAAIGVAGGLLLAPSNWLSTVLLATGIPALSMAITGLWIL